MPKKTLGLWSLFLIGIREEKSSANFLRSCPISEQLLLLISLIREKNLKGEDVVPSSTFEMRVDINAQHLVMKWSQNYIAALGQFWDCLHLPSTHFVTQVENQKREKTEKSDRDEVNVRFTIWS